MAHEPEHEELLLQLVAGDSAPDARAQVESCAVCAPRWHELQSLAASIDAADRERRDLLAESAEPRSAPGSDRVRATLEAERRKTFGNPQSAPRTASRSRLMLLAAALLIAGFFVVRALVPGKNVGPDTPLGTEIRFEDVDYEILSPDVPIRWRFGVDPDRVWFRVQLRGMATDGTARSEEIRVRELEWTPDHQVLSGWRDPVRLWVEAFDRPVDGERLGTSPVIHATVSL